MLSKLVSWEINCLETRVVWLDKFLFLNSKAISVLTYILNVNGLTGCSIKFSFSKNKKKIQRIFNILTIKASCELKRSYLI